jgi:chemotaxis signal transduction protein
MGTPKHKQDHRLFCFLLQNYRFCLRLAVVERLLPLVRMQPIPQAPDYLIGLMNLGGDAIPMIDLALRLGIDTDATYHIDSSVLLTKSGDFMAGLLVDDVLGVRQVSREDIRGDALFHNASSPVLGAVAFSDGTALLLDAVRILDIDLSGLEDELCLSSELLSLCQE